MTQHFKQQTDRSYLQIDYRHPVSTGEDWKPAPQEYPGINKPGVNGDDVPVWEAYVDYLNMSRDGEYRLTRITITTTKDVLQ